MVLRNLTTVRTLGGLRMKDDSILKFYIQFKYSRSYNPGAQAPARYVRMFTKQLKAIPPPPDPTKPHLYIITSH
jgi:hypothetical protein